jgi:hypothetical protein
MVRQQLLALLLRFVDGVDDRRPFSEVAIVPSRTRKSFELIIIIVCSPARRGLK